MLTLLIVAFAFLAIGAAVGLVLNERLLSQLRSLHPDIYEELGSPGRILDDGGSASFAAVREFLRRSEFQSRCCADLLRLSRLTRAYGRVFTALAIVIFLALLFTWRRLI
jgi:hypothetical protein